MSPEARPNSESSSTPAARAAVRLLVALAVFANTFGAGYTYDDRWIVLENPRVHGLGSFVDLVSTPYWGDAGSGLYRPFTLLTFALQWTIHGAAPFFFHLVNVLLHAGVTVLVFGLARRLVSSEPAAFVAGLFFAVHPVHVEAVAGIVGRAELLAAGAVLLALRLALPPSPDTRFGPARIGTVCGLVLLGLLSKEIAVVFAPLYVWTAWILREPRSRIVRVAAATAATTLAFVSLKAVVTGALTVPVESIPFVSNPAAHAPATTRVWTAMAVFADYGRLLVWPDVLSYDYSHAQVPLLESALAPAVLAGTGIAVLLAALALFGRSRIPLAAAGAGWFLIALAPVSNVFFPIGILQAERILYLPSVGAVLLVAALLDRVASSRTGVVVGLGIVLALPLGIRSIVRNADWHSSETLYESGIRTSPESSRTHCELGKLLYNRSLEATSDIERRALEERALAELERGIAIADGYDPIVYTALGYLHERAYRIDRAIESFREARTIEPGLGLAWVEEVRLLVGAGRPDAARATVRELVDATDVRDPGHTRELWQRLAASMRDVGDEDLARASTARSLAVPEGARRP